MARAPLSAVGALPRGVGPLAALCRALLCRVDATLVEDQERLEVRADLRLRLAEALQPVRRSEGTAARQRPRCPLPARLSALALQPSFCFLLVGRYLVYFDKNLQFEWLAVAGPAAGCPLPLWGRAPPLEGQGKPEEAAPSHALIVPLASQAAPPFARVRACGRRPAGSFVGLFEGGGKQLTNQNNNTARRAPPGRPDAGRGGELLARRRAQ